MKTTLLVTFGILASLPAFAVESVGKLGFYKGAEHSSTSHLMIEGSAAKDLYLHMNLVKEANDPTQKINVREGKNIECVSFYGDPGAPFRCYLHMDEAGFIEPGYGP